MEQAAIAESNTARVINSVFEGYTQAVLKNPADYAADPQAVKLDETGAGLNGALWEVGKAKNHLKNLGRNNSKAVHSYNSFDRANMNQYQQRIRAEARRQGSSEQEMLLFSNSASKGGVGRDIDLGLREPPRFITQGGKLMPNPAYTQWSRGLTQTLPDGTVVRLTPGEFQRKMQSVMEISFTDPAGRGRKLVQSHGAAAESSFPGDVRRNAGAMSWNGQGHHDEARRWRRRRGRCRITT